MGNVSDEVDSTLGSLEMNLDIIHGVVDDNNNSEPNIVKIFTNIADLWLTIVT